MEIKTRKDLGKLLEHFELKGDAAEIGVAEGRHSQILIQQPAIERLYMIDAWKQLNQKGDGHNPQSWHENNFKEAMERTYWMNEKRVVLRGLSKDMIPLIPDNSLVLAYVDGDHSYEGCLSDLKAIWPKIKVGGILAGHDILNPAYGVQRAVQGFMEGRTDILVPSEIETVFGCEIHIIEEDEPVNASFWVRKR